MKVLVIGGFLGTGKTTLLMHIARELIGRSLKIAVIENEVGDIGVDNQYLELEGINVQELYGGCVCCVLKGSLLSMLDKIETAINPDWVLLEPSGVASPDDLAATVRTSANKLTAVKIVNLLDAPRFFDLESILEPMVHGYILCADTVVINKIDEVDEIMLAEIRNKVESIKPGTNVVAICADSGANVLALIDSIVTP